MVRITEDKTCQIAVINTAPHEIYLEGGDFLGVIEALEQHLTEVHPAETIPVASLFLFAMAPRNIATDRLLQQTLNHTPAERWSAVEDLIRRHAGLLQPSTGPHCWMLRDPQQVQHPEPVYQKRNKIPQAHLPVIEDSLEQWI